MNQAQWDLLERKLKNTVVLDLMKCKLKEMEVSCNKDKGHKMYKSYRNALICKYSLLFSAVADVVNGDEYQMLGDC